MTDDPIAGCGISNIWLTRVDDPFKSACDWHDSAYESGSSEQQIYSRKTVDTIFLNIMLREASTLYLKARAHLFYGLVRAFGGKYWEGEK